MEILKDILIKDLFLYLKRHKTLVISDLHLGYEEALQSQGYLIPKSGFADLKLRLSEVINALDIDRIVINGDIVHRFSGLRRIEKDIVRDFLKIVGEKAIIIKGNHDKTLQFIIPDHKMVDELIIGDILITHGDIINKHTDDKKVKTIIIGHDHPSIGLTAGARIEKYKCFLKGKYKRKNLIVMPSCNLLVEGSDILKERLLSPYLSDISNFDVYIIEDRVYDFGKIKILRK